MGSTALQIAQSACNNANLYAPLTSFTLTDFPMNGILSCINMAIADMNRAGSYEFGKDSASLPYTPGVLTYNLDSFANTVVESRRIIAVWRELPNQAGKLSQYNHFDFKRRFRNNTIPTTKPLAWAKYGEEMQLNCYPDQDYDLKLYYYMQIQPVVPGTNDNLPTIIPSYHEDVLISLTKAYILQLTKNPDFASEYTLAMGRVRALVARSLQDAGIPQQMPRSF